jgi:hypothetical protein
LMDGWIIWEMNLEPGEGERANRGRASRMLSVTTRGLGRSVLVRGKVIHWTMRCPSPVASRGLDPGRGPSCASDPFRCPRERLPAVL